MLGPYGQELPSTIKMQPLIDLEDVSLDRRRSSRRCSSTTAAEVIVEFIRQFFFHQSSIMSLISIKMRAIGFDASRP